jgi:enamine deaminase RidA (YjgF/YER057c/UK114 family)
MTDTTTANLAALGITLGTPPSVAGAYTPTLATGHLLFVSGQVAADTTGLIAEGVLGAEVDIETGITCARQCAVNVLTQVAASLGGLDRVERVVKVTVYVASAPGFTNQPQVANGASELFNIAFGDDGVHTRAAVGVTALPGGSPVEVEAIFQIQRESK